MNTEVVLDEYISRDAAIKILCTVAAPTPTESWIVEKCIDRVNELPAADVRPVVHGRWESVKNPQWPAYSHDMCSICGWWNTKNALCYDGRKKPGHSLNYCPNCGAVMDGGSNG